MPEASKGSASEYPKKHPPTKGFAGLDPKILSEGLKPISLGDIITGPAIERLSKAQPGDVQEIAASQIQLLNSYYSVVLSQAQRSFLWALVVACVGLLFFLGSVAFVLTRQAATGALISLIGGSLIEVIAGINFYLYGKTSAQLGEFHTRLELTQRLSIGE